MKISELVRRRILRTANQNSASEPQGTTIITDKWGMRFVYYPGESEPYEDTISKEFYKPELLAIRKLIKPSSIVIDIGANIGLFSIFLSSQVGQRGRVFAFEPVRETFWRMKENLAMNKCENVIPYQIALSNKRGVKRINTFPARYSAWSSFGKPKFDTMQATSSERVATTTLDLFAKEYELKKIQFAKIDVEGFERDVLEGSKSLLSNGVIQYLSFEISEIPLKGAGRSAKDVFDLLKSYGYKSYEFNPRSKKFKGPLDNSEAFYQNYYASKADLTKL